MHEKVRMKRKTAKERKAAGYKYCDCAACAAVEAILEKKSELV